MGVPSTQRMSEGKPRILARLIKKRQPQRSFAGLRALRCKQSEFAHDERIPENPKNEARNSKQIRNENDQNPKQFRQADIPHFLEW